MTDPDDKPSFLARLAVVATIGVLALQVFMWVWREQFLRGQPSVFEVWLLFFFPFFAHIAISVIYYLFKGMPTNADIVVKHQIQFVWNFSYVVSFVLYLFYIWG